MVTKFPLDYMHLILLGVMRKLIRVYMSGRKRHRLSSTAIAEISERLVTYKQHTPSELSRKPRSLQEFKYWKATEFRSILLYFGVCAFRDILPDRQYSNFMMLVCAMRILLTDTLCDLYHEYAGTLLYNFVKDCVNLYGSKIATYNMHATIHLADEAEMYGPLDNISAFPFENHLYQLKRMIRKPGSTLPQLINRVREKQVFGNKNKKKVTGFKFIRPHHDGPVPRGYENCEQYDTVQRTGVTYSRNLRDSCVMFEEEIGQICNIIAQGNSAYCVIRPFRSKNDFFQYPTPSSAVNVHVVHTHKGTLTVAPIDDCLKCILLPVRDGAHVAMQLCSADRLV